MASEALGKLTIVPSLCFYRKNLLATGSVTDEFQNQ
jgi:hypothetical protein